MNRYSKESQGRMPRFTVPWHPALAYLAIFIAFSSNFYLAFSSNFYLAFSSNFYLACSSNFVYLYLVQVYKVWWKGILEKDNKTVRGAWCAFLLIWVYPNLTMYRPHLSSLKTDQQNPNCFECSETYVKKRVGRKKKSYFFFA